MSIVDSKLRNKKRSLNSLHCISNNISTLNLDIFSDLSINVIEIHLTDICDLKCDYCSYRSGTNKKRNTLSYINIDQIIKLKPKAIVLAGGGEPALYKDNNYDIHDVVNTLTKNGIAIGLITNGGKEIKLDVLGKLSWLRVSLDAIGEKTFFALKKGKFTKRIKFLENALKSDCKYIGIGFLYNDNNISEIISVCEYIYSHLKDDKINIQFRPTCKIQSCDCQSENYRQDNILTSNMDPWWAEKIKNLKSEFVSLKESKYQLYKFIIDQTNFLSILNSDFNRKKSTFNKCYLSLARWIVRANGEIYPCVMKATNAGIPIGNINYNSTSQIKKEMKKYFELSQGYCKGSIECCNFVSDTNNLIEEHLKTKLVNDTTVTNEDYFF